MTPKLNKTLSLIIFYALASTFIIPTQILANPVPANFNVKQIQVNVIEPSANPDQIEWKIKAAKSTGLDGKGTDRTYL